MATDHVPDNAPAAAGVTPSLTVRSLVSRYRAASAGVAVFVALLIAVTVLGVASGSNPAALNDATTCLNWASASASQQNAYSFLYVKEHEATLPDSVAYAAVARTAISKACVQAAYLGEADDVSVLGAIRHAF